TFFKEGQSQTIEQIFGTTRGRHSFRFGAMYGWLWGGRENIETPIARYANAADFLANRPNSVQVTFGVDSYRITTGSLGFFIQDDFRVTKRLIVNMGIRWDYYKVPRERDGRLFNREEPFGFGPYRPPNSIWDTDYNNFSPRIGFAYSVDGASTTVVRGGFGVFQNPRPLFGGPVDLVQNALDEPFRVVYSAADVAAHPDILRYPVVNSKVLPLAKGPAALLAGTAINPNWGNPFSYQWSAGLQKQLHRNTLIEASYVGTRGIGLMMVRTMNAPNRVTGIRPMTNFATFRYRDGSEQTNYHALQTSLRQRLTAGLTFNVNYTWSRNMSYTGDADLLLPGSPQDIWNVRGDYGPSNIDARHRFVVDYVYELPLEKLSSSNGAAARMLLRGWQISGVFSAQSGSPFNPSQPSGLDGSRPDYIGGEAILSDADSTLQYVNPAAFRQVPLNAVSRLPERGGSIGRNALYGPGWWDTNTTLAKAISITEQMRLQLRVEMLNALNHTSMSGVNGNVTQGNFGRFTSTRGARVIQVGARFSF
ncbi:MAG: TonB-dependent receptor, partial [Bryobacterales bacterium]|nr:TonB-dependent receptor [Bryobacterales bacterium]